MSYLTLPRIHFSGSFQAYPSTINNYPDNYNPLVYPSANKLKKVALGWGPRGNGNFAFKDCVITQVDYADGTSATTAAEDPIIGQPVSTVKRVNFPLSATIVDLDPQQQMVSELWAMCVQIGSNEAYIKGDFAPAAFTGIWGQVQVSPPPSSTSAAATYQSTLSNITSAGLTSGSKFLQYFSDNPATLLSINFVVNAHNNNPQLYDFSANTGVAKLKAAGVPQDVITALEPLQEMQQNFNPENGKPINPGYIPTKDFLTYILQQFLTVEQYNANIDKMLVATKLPYKGYSSYDYTYGQVTGTVGTGADTVPAFFVPSRRMYPTGGYPNPPKPPTGVNDAYFTTSADGKTVTINLNNSIATESPGGAPLSSLGTLQLVTLPTSGPVTADNVTPLTTIPYTDAGFFTKGAGFFTYTHTDDLSTTPLGILSSPSGTATSGTANKMMLQENQEGYYLRADQFVFRMNPGVQSTPQNPRGSTASLDIYVLKFGQPVADGTTVDLSFQDVSGLGYNPAIGTPTEALSFASSATTTGGKATFTLTAKPPKNPRKFIDGQIYFLDYTIQGQVNNDGQLNNPNSDFISIQVYDEVTEADGLEVLNKFGRLYKIMGFLTDQETVEQMDMRNMIKLLLERPWDQVQHMPVSRDMSMSAQNKVTEWINSLNNA